MTEIDKDWCINMAKKEGIHNDISAGRLAMNPILLSERVEAHTGGDDWALRVAIAEALGWTHKQVGGVVAWYSPDRPDNMKAGPPKWLTSLDAAMMLVQDDHAVNSIRQTTEVEKEEHTGDVPLPNWTVTLVRQDCAGYWNRKKFLEAFKRGGRRHPRTRTNHRSIKEPWAMNKIEIAGIVIQPSFAAFVAAEEELGPLFTLVERAAAGQLKLSEMVALFWHCRLDAPADLSRHAFSDAVAGGGLASATPVLKRLLAQILEGRGL